MATLISRRSLETSLPNETQSDLSRSQVRSTNKRRSSDYVQYANKRIRKQNSITLRRASSLRRRQLRASMSSQDRGQLKILIHLDKSNIAVNVFAARKLMSSDKRVCNPYVKVLLRDDDKSEKGCIWKRTKPVQNNRNPRFNEQFTFALKECPRNGRIIIAMFNRVGTRNEFIGCMSFGIRSIFINQKEVSGWYHLLDRDVGRRKHQPVVVQRPRSRLNSTSKLKPKLVTVERGDDGRYGFTLLDTLPVRVNTIVPGGPAEKVGLKCNDLFLELNGFNVVGSSCKTIVELIAQAPGKLCLLVQPYADIRENLMTLSAQTLSVTPALSVRRLTVTPAAAHCYKQSTSGRKALQEVNQPSIFADKNGIQNLFNNPSVLNSSTDNLCPRSLKSFQFLPSNLNQEELHPMYNKQLPSNSYFVKPRPVIKNALANQPSTSFHPYESNSECAKRMLINAHQTQTSPSSKVINHIHMLPLMQSSPSGEQQSLYPVSQDSVDGHNDSLLSDSSFISTSSLSDDSLEQQNSMYEALLLEKLEATGVAEIASVFSLPFFQGNSLIVPTPKLPEKPKVPEKPKIPVKPKISVKPKLPHNLIPLSEKPKTMTKPKVPEKPKHLTKQYSSKALGNKDGGMKATQQITDPWLKFSSPDKTPAKRKSTDLLESVTPKYKKICHSIDPHLIRLELMQKGKNKLSNPQMKSIPTSKFDVHSKVSCVPPNRNDISSSSNESILSDGSAGTIVGNRSLTKEDEMLQNNEAVYIVDMVKEEPSKDVEKDASYLEKFSKLNVAENEDSEDNREDVSHPKEVLSDGNVCDSDGCVCQCVAVMGCELAKSKKGISKQMIVLGGIKREVIFNKKVDPFMVDGRDFIHAGKLFLRKKINKIQEVLGILFSDMLIFTKHVVSSNKIKVLFPPVKFSEVNVMEFITKRATEFHIIMVTMNHPAALKSNKIILGAPTSRLKKVWQFLLQQYILEFKVAGLKNNGVQHLHTEIEINGETMESNNNRPGLSPSSSKQSNNGGILTRTSTTGIVNLPDIENESGTHSNMLSSTNCCECESTPAMNKATPVLRTNRSFPYLRNEVVSSAPNSPINKGGANSHTMLERQQSSPTNMMLTDEISAKKGKRKTSIFKRFSGKNKDEVSGKGTKEKASKKDSKEKKTVNNAVQSRRAMSVGDERMLHGVDNNIPTLEEGEELAGHSFQRHSVVSDKPVRKSSRNLAKDLKDKVRSLRRRHTDSALRDTDKLKPPLPSCTLQEVKQWSESFDRLLRDKCGLEAFRRFLQTEFSDENIEFWLACEEYRTLSPSKHINRARKIHEDYVATQAPREVNLDSATRIETTSNVRKPDEHTFDNAQKRIEALMEKDSYPRFLKSDIYQQLLRTSKDEC